MYPIKHLISEIFYIAQKIDVLPIFKDNLNRGTKRPKNEISLPLVDWHYYTKEK